MHPRIINIKDKKLVGQRLIMNLANYQIGKLWASFNPRRKEINNKVTNELISLAIYDKAYFTNFNPTNHFERWAAVEASNYSDIPSQMEPFDLPSGLYAVFNYKGLSSDNSIFLYIFSEWIPNSIYELDQRPHFEVLGEKYKNNDLSSEEEIWIPIHKK